MAKTYLSGNAKEVVFKDGNSVFNVYVDLDDAKEKGLLIKTKAGKNGLAFSIAKKQEVGQYGDTHYLYVNPMGSGGGSKSPEVKQPRVAGSAQRGEAPEKPSATTDDLPF